MDLLLPLAYAQGGGLPWEDMWPLLANALAPGHGYTNEDLLWLAGHAGSFIVEGGTIAGPFYLPALPPLPSRRPDRQPRPSRRPARHHHGADRPCSSPPQWAA